MFIKETANLNDREKKVLYAPKKYREKVKRQVDLDLSTTDFEIEEIKLQKGDLFYEKSYLS